jgi:predicted transposase/invertase (TIGR01784 family)
MYITWEDVMKIRRCTVLEEDLDKFDLETCDDATLRFYQMRKMAVMDFNSSVRAGREEGFEKGRQKGRLEMIKKMKAMGISIEQISKATGLSPEKIETLE